MTSLARGVFAVAVLASAAFAAPQAEAARVAIGVGIGVPMGGYYGPGYWGPYYGPRYVYYPPPAVFVPSTPAPAVPAAPEPIFYPSKGQTLEQTESDRQDCNRWAATQASALSDATVFQRATYACMEGRGYTVK